MTIDYPIGLAKGPGETPQDFTFVSPDRGQTLKVGEFITYEVEADGEARRILSRITDRRPLRLYPDAFLAEPEINPDLVANLIGYRQGEYELFEVTATVIGYYDEVLEGFINPHLPPRAGRPIYLASDEILARLLTKKQSVETGSAQIGSLLSRDLGKVPIIIDVAAIASTHMAIIASTGAGKSYLAGVLVEELMSHYNRAAVLVVDPHGEYDTLVDMMGNTRFQSGDYRPEVRIFRPGDVKVRISALEISDLYYLLPNLSDRMMWLLGRAYREVSKISRQEKGQPDRWTRGELEIYLRQLGEGRDSESEDGSGKSADYTSTAEALNWRLESVLKHSLIFDDFKHLNLDELCRPGRCSVLQLNEVDEKEQQVMVATLLRRLLKARTHTVKKQVSEGDELYLPYPVFVLIEEAHRFAPASEDAVSTRVLKTILSEGRKFGVAVGLISQRPGRLDADVLSQCNTQFIMRIVNPVDQARVAESVETVGRDLLRELPALTKGQVIIAGEAVNTPVLCRVRKRHTRHGGETMDAPAEWLHYFDTEEQERLKRSKALPAQRPRDRKSKMFKE